MGAWVTRFKEDVIYMYAGAFRYSYEAEGFVQVAGVILLFSICAYYEVYLCYLWVFLNQ